MKGTYGPLAGTQVQSLYRQSLKAHSEARSRARNGDFPGAAEMFINAHEGFGNTRQQAMKQGKARTLKRAKKMQNRCLYDAKRCFQKAVPASKSREERESIYSQLYAMQNFLNGGKWCQSADYEQASRCYETATDAFKKLKNKPLADAAATWKGMIAHRMENLPKAREAVKKARGKQKLEKAAVLEEAAGHYQNAQMGRQAKKYLKMAAALYLRNEEASKAKAIQKQLAKMGGIKG